MTNRALKIALAVSVALNLFGLAGGVAAWVTQEKAERHVEGPPQPTRPGFRQIMDGLDPSVRDRVRATFRAAAQAARPDFQASREARQAAITLAASPTGDPAQVAALLDQSRAAEIRGRERMERDVVPLFATLSPADRQSLSVLLNKRGRGDGPRDGGGGEKR